MYSILNYIHSILFQHISDFFLAGAETTATTLRWACLYLANNQEVQEKVHKEIVSNIQKEHILSLKVGQHTAIGLHSNYHVYKL